MSHVQWGWIQKNSGCQKLFRIKTPGFSTATTSQRKMRERKGAGGRKRRKGWQIKRHLRDWLINYIKYFGQQGLNGIWDLNSENPLLTIMKGVTAMKITHISMGGIKHFSRVSSQLHISPVCWRLTMALLFIISFDLHNDPIRYSLTIFFSPEVMELRLRGKYTCWRSCTW